MISSVLFSIHMCIVFDTHEIFYKPLYIKVYSTFKSACLLTLYIRGFSPRKGRVVFFEKTTQKISTLKPLHSEILTVIWTLPRRLSNAINFLSRLGLFSITVKNALHLFLIYSLNANKDTLRGFAPTRRANYSFQT